MFKIKRKRIEDYFDKYSNLKVFIRMNFQQNRIPTQYKFRIERKGVIIFMSKFDEIEVSFSESQLYGRISILFRDCQLCAIFTDCISDIIIE